MALRGQKSLSWFVDINYSKSALYSMKLYYLVSCHKRMVLMNLHTKFTYMYLLGINGQIGARVFFAVTVVCINCLYLCLIWCSLNTDFCQNHMLCLSFKSQSQFRAGSSWNLFNHTCHTCSEFDLCDHIRLCPAKHFIFCWNVTSQFKKKRIWVLF